jgi:hypothetical protein
MLCLRKSRLGRCATEQEMRGELGTEGRIACEERSWVAYMGRLKKDGVMLEIQSLGMETSGMVTHFT